MKYSRGFTILELLVVIAIIGILSSVTLAFVSSVRQKSRDAKRVDDMGQISKALHLYAIDNAVFPIAVSEIDINGETDALSVALEGAGSIPSVPTDPNAGTPYTYQSNGATYTLGFCLETDTIKGYAQGCGNTVTP